MLKRFRKLTVLLLAAALLLGCIAQISPVYAAETETEDYSISLLQDGVVYKQGSFTLGEDGLYTYSTSLSVSESGWSEYELSLTINGTDYGAEDWVIYDCTDELQLFPLEDNEGNGVFSLWFCNTRKGTYTFTLDPEEFTLTVNGDSDDYGAFLVFTELVEYGENPYYYMDDLGVTDTFETAEKTMMVKAPSWEPDGYWDVQIASGGKFYGNDAVAIEGASNEVCTLEENQTFTFASDAPHLWYDFYFGAESHKLIVKDGGPIMVDVNFLVSNIEGEPLDAKIIVNGQEVSEQESYVEATTLNVKAPKIAGYHFVGWYGSPNEDEWWEKDDELLWVEPEFEYTVREFSFEMTKTQSLEAVYEEGDEVVSVTGITLDQTSATMATSKTNTDKKPYEIKEPSTFQLTAAIEPENATNQTVIWSSSNENAASVDENGLVTAYHYNKAPVVITARTEDGDFTATCSITILFNDVAGNSQSGTPGYQYFFKPVYWAADHEPTITNGYETIFFGTGMNCKREDMITFLWRAAGKPAYRKATTFEDVPKGKYYYDPIMWAAENGITKGYGDGTFGVGKEITREDTVTFIYRAAGKPNYKQAKSFKDVAKGKYYYNAIMWAAENGITNGYTSGEYAGKFGVGLNVKREDIVTFLYRAASKNLL